MHIKLVLGYDYPQEIAALFSEYTHMLVEKDATFGEYLQMQAYEEEIAHIQTKYGLPDGRLYVAYFEGKLAGCIGLRKIDEQNCEMKRLYVRPEFRKHHVGRRLIEQIIQDAKEIGYTRMLLDTLPFLQNAIHLYKQYGFYETLQYNDNPMNTAIYMALDL